MTSRACTWPETPKKSAGSSCESKNTSSGSPATPTFSASRTTGETTANAPIWVPQANRTSPVSKVKCKADEVCKLRRRGQ